MKIRFYIITITLLLCSLSTSAQHYLGLRGGWGGGSARFMPVKEMGYQWGLYSGGVSYKFYSDVKYVGAVEFDLQYIQKGFRYDITNKSDTSYNRTINSVELPFMWQPHFYIFNRHGRIFVNLGVQFSYNIDSEHWHESRKNGVFDKEKYPLLLTRDNRWGYGLVGGAGFSVFMGRIELALEGRYYFGYSDILRNKTKYQGNPLQSPLDNITGSIALYYRLGKEGLRSEPSASMLKKMEAMAAKRLLKQANKKQKLSNDE